MTSMKLRRKAPPNFLESLLDTLANVVGILIIIAVVTQISMGEAVRKISSGAPKQSEPDIAAQLAEARKQLAGAQQEAESLKKQIETTAAAVQAQRLKNERAVKVVRLPNPRQPEPGMAEMAFFCRNGRVHPVEYADARKAIDAAVRATAKPGDSDRQKAEALKRHLKENQVGTKWFRFDLEIEVDGAKVIQRVRFHAADPEQGETLAEAERPGSLFDRTLKAIDPRRQYLFFFVWEDSFDVYTGCRQIADERRIPAGWDPLAVTTIFSHTLNATPKAPTTPPLD
jgi:hypothetical protein